MAFDLRRGALFFNSAFNFHLLIVVGIIHAPYYNATHPQVMNDKLSRSASDRHRICPTATIGAACSSASSSGTKPR
jgi:hypothetical protein